MTIMGNDNVKDYPPYLDYPKPRKPITKADCVRSMTDEELAEALWLTAKGGIIGQRSKECWLDWLRQEVDDGKKEKEENQPAK